MTLARSSILGRFASATLAALGALGGGCDSDSHSPQGATANLEVECLGDAVSAPDAAWLCPEARTFDCSSALPPIYVRDPLNPSCAPSYTAQTVDPLRPGIHPVRVARDDGSLACETTITITDSAAPVLTPKTINLWPPNHKFHTISVADCVTVTDSCEPDLRAEFVWASSDEPIDGLGDGHHAPDIVVDDCERVQVRAERQGPRDGRVYKLGVRVVDSAGNAAESACTILVDHDQRGVPAADSSEKYRVTFDGQNGLPSCDGDQPPPPTMTPRDASVPPSTPDAGTGEPMVI